MIDKADGDDISIRDRKRANRRRRRGVAAVRRSDTLQDPFATFHSQYNNYTTVNGVVFMV